MDKEECDYCGKVIEGHNKNQAEYLLKQHIIAKHPEKVKFGEIEKRKGEDQDE